MNQLHHCNTSQISLLKSQVKRKVKNAVSFGHSEDTWAFRMYSRNSMTWGTLTLEGHLSTRSNSGTLFRKHLVEILSHYTFLLSCFHTPLVIPINIFRHLSFCCKGTWKKWESTIGFVAQLLDLPLICLATESLFLGISEKLNLCYYYKKEPHTLLKGI